VSREESILDRLTVSELSGDWSTIEFLDQFVESRSPRGPGIGRHVHVHARIRLVILDIELEASGRRFQIGDADADQ